MSILSKLFGGAPNPDPTPEPHKGFRIFPAPLKDAGQYRIAARIEKDIDGQTKTHQMIRADKFASLEQATEVSILKAKQVIDQQGDAIFRA